MEQCMSIEMIGRNIFPEKVPFNLYPMLLVSSIRIEGFE